MNLTKSEFTCVRGNPVIIQLTNDDKIREFGVDTRIYKKKLPGEIVLDVLQELPKKEKIDSLLGNLCERHLKLDRDYLEAMYADLEVKVRQYIVSNDAYNGQIAKYLIDRLDLEGTPVFVVGKGWCDFRETEEGFTLKGIREDDLPGLLANLFLTPEVLVEEILPIVAEVTGVEYEKLLRDRKKIKIASPRNFVEYMYGLKGIKAIAAAQPGEYAISPVLGDGFDATNIIHEITHLEDSLYSRLGERLSPEEYGEGVAMLAVINGIRILADARKDIYMRNEIDNYDLAIVAANIASYLKDNELTGKEIINTMEEMGLSPRIMVNIFGYGWPAGKIDPERFKDSKKYKVRAYEMAKYFGEDVKVLKITKDNWKKFLEDMKTAKNKQIKLREMHKKIKLKANILNYDSYKIGGESGLKLSSESRLKLLEYKRGVLEAEKKLLKSEDNKIREKVEEVLKGYDMSRADRLNSIDEEISDFNKKIEKINKGNLEDIRPLDLIWSIKKPKSRAKIPIKEKTTAPLSELEKEKPFLPKKEEKTENLFNSEAALIHALGLSILSVCDRIKSVGASLKKVFNKPDKEIRSILNKNDRFSRSEFKLQGGIIRSIIRLSDSLYIPPEYVASRLLGILQENEFDVEHYLTDEFLDRFRETINSELTEIVNSDYTKLYFQFDTTFQYEEYPEVGDFVVDSFKNVKSGYFVSFGGGPGKHFKKLLDAIGFHGEKLNIDSSEEAVRKSNEIGIPASMQDVQDLKLEAGSVDAGIAAFLLEYIVELGKALAEINRVLRPGGKVVFLFHYPDSPIAQQASLRNKIFNEQIRLYSATRDYILSGFSKKHKKRYEDVLNNILETTTNEDTHKIADNTKRLVKEIKSSDENHEEYVIQAREEYLTRLSDRISELSIIVLFNEILTRRISPLSLWVKRIEDADFTIEGEPKIFKKQGINIATGIVAIKKEKPSVKKAIQGNPDLRTDGCKVGRSLLPFALLPGKARKSNALDGGFIAGLNEKGIFNVDMLNIFAEEFPDVAARKARLPFDEMSNRKKFKFGRLLKIFKYNSINIPKNAKFLDIGYGGDINIAIIAEYFEGIPYGIDISRHKVDFINNIFGNVTDILPKIKDNAFDVIIMFNSFSAICAGDKRPEIKPIDKKWFLDEIKRILNPAGIVVINDISEDIQALNINIEELSSGAGLTAIKYELPEEINGVLKINKEKVFILKNPDTRLREQLTNARIYQDGGRIEKGQKDLSPAEELREKMDELKKAVEELKIENSGVNEIEELLERLEKKSIIRLIFGDKGLTGEIKDKLSILEDKVESARATKALWIRTHLLLPVMIAEKYIRGPKAKADFLCSAIAVLKENDFITEEVKSGYIGRLKAIEDYHIRQQEAIEQEIDNFIEEINKNILINQEFDIEELRDSICEDYKIWIGIRRMLEKIAKRSQEEDIALFKPSNGAYNIDKWLVELERKNRKK